VTFEQLMQQKLGDCPGFIGCDAPKSASCTGKVMVDPARITEAMPWLRRRFYCSENLELSTDCGLCVEIAPRIRKPGVKRVPVHFGKIEQFSFDFI